MTDETGDGFANGKVSPAAGTGGDRKGDALRVAVNGSETKKGAKRNRAGDYPAYHARNCDPTRHASI
jgi:hypothetical protein